jgi:hypothetical protein
MPPAAQAEGADDDTHRDCSGSIAVIIKVLLRSDNPVAEALPLNILQLLRWRIPAAAILAISLDRRTRRAGVGATTAHAGNTQDERKRCDCKSIQGHLSISPLLLRTPSIVLPWPNSPQSSPPKKVLLHDFSFGACGKLLP